MLGALIWEMVKSVSRDNTSITSTCRLAITLFPTTKIGAKRRSNAKTGRNTRGPINQLSSPSREKFLTSVLCGEIVRDSVDLSQAQSPYIHTYSCTHH